MVDPCQALRLQQMVVLLCVGLYQGLGKVEARFSWLKCALAVERTPQAANSIRQPCLIRAEIRS
jgi:hypothetical protein